MSLYFNDFVRFLFFVLVFLSSAPSVAEITDNMNGEKIEEFGPNGCSKSMEPLHVWLENKEGKRTDFMIPKAYFGYSINKKSGKDNLVYININLSDMSAECLSRNFSNKDKEYTKNFITARFSKIQQGAIQQFFGYQVLNDNPHFIGLYKGYSVFSSKSKHDLHRDTLLPPAYSFENETFLICKRKNLKDPNRTLYDYSSCEIHTNIDPNIWVVIHSIRSQDIHDIDLLNSVYKRVTGLVTSFIITPENEGKEQ
ncbi:hypothetical protein [Aliikangiella sp. IMCC44359]|uniref:hypothetical protein n=1 Tax=Aliikangiella sp. IMCC44359 TaxID=3459125 RepID=UPI00403B35F4